MRWALARISIVIAPSLLPVVMLIASGDHPLNHMYVYQIDRLDSTSAKFSVWDSDTGALVGSPVTRTFSGAMDDGTFGLMAVKDAGGTAIVQHPYEAFVPSMPLSAIQNVEVDHIVRTMLLWKL